MLEPRRDRGDRKIRRNIEACAVLCYLVRGLLLLQRSTAEGPVGNDLNLAIATFIYLQVCKLVYFAIMS